MQKRYNIGILTFDNFKNEIFNLCTVPPFSPPLLPAVFQSAGVRPGARVGQRVEQPSLILLNLGWGGTLGERLTALAPPVGRQLTRLSCKGVATAVGEEGEVAVCTRLG